LGPARDIDTLVARWREAAAGPARNADTTSARGDAAYRRVAADLRRTIWDPVAPHLAGATRVFIVPDGALHLVNFAALPSGTTSYLAEVGPRLHYLSAERDLVTAKPSTIRQGLLAIGNPAFDGRPQTMAARAPVTAATGSQSAEQVYRGPRPTCGGFPSMRFAALPASGKEVHDIAALWDQRRDEAGPNGAAKTDPHGSALLLTGAAASEARFKQAAHGQRVLHLATHGFFLGGECASDFGALSTASSESPLRAVTSENPLLLSGLVFAGANHRQSVGRDDEDGILTAEEVAALDLTGTEWAVLSACDTGAGEVRAGEGIFGLRRAFQVAGARTVIMSLSPVDDEAARLWMRALYRQHFVEAKTTADAVHGADLELLQQRRQKGLSTHPFYWASFVAAGDWR
jgi:CHAT domain-containing protein